jgi:hypothetical protein
MFVTISNFTVDDAGTSYCVKLDEGMGEELLSCQPLQGVLLQHTLYSEELYLTLSKRNSSILDPYVFGPPGSGSFSFLLEVLSGKNKEIMVEK